MLFRSEEVSALLSKFGLTVLKNKNIFWPEKNTWIVGLDDNYWGFHDLKKAFSDVPKNTPTILLAHSPDIVDELTEDRKPNLILSAHTHCGQIRLPFLGALPFTIPTQNGKKFEGGLYDLGKTKLFVTCGVGETGTRARLDRKSTRLNSSHTDISRMPSSA